MRTSARSALWIMVTVVWVLGASSGGLAQARIDPTHRSALERFLQASRTLAVVRHSGIPTMITSTAVHRWGFTLGEVRVAEIVPHVDVSALEGRIVEIHAVHLTADQAARAAEFYERPRSRRLLADLLRGSLPSTDPLFRENLAPPTEADRRAFQGFTDTALGAHVRAVTPSINEEVLRAVDDAADVAVERYVARRALPNRRLQRAPAEGRR